ncbi:MAG: hypothetical protein NDF54_03240 [archaeon GB-1867-035]|nr:hypothetical protein [Candidatus Culexmicrobium profundum]
MKDNRDLSILGLMIKDEVAKAQLNSWVESTGEMPKRYFIMNAFDETVAFLGLILGAYFGDFLSPKIVIISLVNAGVAMSISSFIVALLIEGAEATRIIDLIKYKVAVKRASFLARLERYNRRYIFKTAMANGSAALISAFLISLPYAMALGNIFSVLAAFYFSIIVIIILLFVLGFLLGRIAKRRELLYCFSTIIAGTLTGIICMLLGFIE